MLRQEQSYDSRFAGVGAALAKRRDLVVHKAGYARRRVLQSVRREG